jgi:hypothetical protein
MQPEISFSFGVLRQPGVWGKILRPPASGIFDVDLISDEHLEVKGGTTTVRPPHLYNDLLLIFGIKGFQKAGMLSSCFALMKVKEGAQLDFQFPGHMARFGGKDVELLATAEHDLETIYPAAKEHGYLDVDRVRQTLRNEGKDRGPQAK